MKQRIIGFDLARAYAILGMFIVNFNTVFGSLTDKEGLSGFLNLFNGNSSTIFVMLAGMGVSLFTTKGLSQLDLRTSQRGIILKRSWFLFFFGLLFYLWWPADILHFYGGYMHLAALILFVPKRYYLVAAGLAIAVFHLLFVLVPFDTGWNFETFQYADFLTIEGFLRNTFYNGWNPIFPWVAYFFVGQYLGRLNWQNSVTVRNTIVIGLLLLLPTQLLQHYAPLITSNSDVLQYIQADYLPPFLPFMLSTMGFGMVVIGISMRIGEKVAEYRIAKVLATMGKLTLTHYVSHITIGFIFLAIITGKPLDEQIMELPDTPPVVILLFAIGYFMVSCLLSHLWLKKFSNGPLETLMRKISG